VTASTAGTVPSVGTSGVSGGRHDKNVRVLCSERGRNQLQSENSLWASISDVKDGAVAKHFSSVV
jgi:hypothetical protein